MCSQLALFIVNASKFHNIVHNVRGKVRVVVNYISSNH